MLNSIFETGDDLITLAKKARKWFESNNVAVPIGAAAWKLSLSKTVKFAYSLQEVEDIVRPLVKASGLTVDHSRNVLRSSA